MEIVLPNRLRAEVTALGINTGAVPEEGLEAEQFAVDIRKLDDQLLDGFYNFLKMHSDARTARTHINAWRKAQTDPTGSVGGSLRVLASQMMDHVVVDAIEGWMFKMADEPIAALITNIVFHPAKKTREGVIPAYISVSYQQNDRGKVVRSSMHMDAENVGGRTVAEAFAHLGWQKETAELHQAYQASLAHYKQIRPMYGKQLRLTKSISHNPNKRRDWYNDTPKERDVDLMSAGNGRLVHDDKIPEGIFSVRPGRNWDDPDNPTMGQGMTSVIEQKLPKDTTAFSRSPYTMTTKVFHLDRHINFEVHVDYLKVYEYDKKLRGKLILPPMYGTVLDVLTNDMLAVQDDIIEGKTGGNVILLAGPPGLGKTLTAEVYAEHREVPLYKIHSGQLGTSPESIEKKLTEVYERATAWGCPVLLDEFDVFGRARGDNLVQNAVVAVFLRTLEYQKNTIFLTTNRADTMDDAILSRCKAIIKFDYPEYEELGQIWKVQRANLMPACPDEVIDELMTFFTAHDKKMSGRDVKNTLQLAAQWVAATKEEPTVALLKTCAGFRGI